MAGPESHDDVETAQEAVQDDAGDKDLVVGTDNNKAEDFARLDSLGDGFTDYMNQSGPFRRRLRADEPDKKLEALKSFSFITANNNEVPIPEPRTPDFFGYKTAYEILKDADALVVVTEWSEFRRPNFERMIKLMKTPIVFDGRNILDHESLRKIGFEVWAIGKS